MQELRELEALAERIYVHNGFTTPSEAFERASEFVAYREKRREEVQEQHARNGDVERHRFEPAQGNNTACLACGREKGAHLP